MRRRRQVRIAHAEVDDVGAGIARRRLGAVDLLEHIGRQTANAVKFFHEPPGARCLATRVPWTCAGIDRFGERGRAASVLSRVARRCQRASLAVSVLRAAVQARPGGAASASFARCSTVLVARRAAAVVAPPDRPPASPGRSRGASARAGRRLAGRHVSRPTDAAAGRAAPAAPAQQQRRRERARLGPKSAATAISNIMPVQPLADLQRHPSARPIPDPDLVAQNAKLLPIQAIASYSRVPI